MWPLGSIIVEETCGGEEWNYLIYATSEGMLIVIAVVCDEHHHNEECEDEGDADIELHFYVI